MTVREAGIKVEAREAGAAHSNAPCRRCAHGDGKVSGTPHASTCGVTPSVPARLKIPIDVEG